MSKVQEIKNVDDSTVSNLLTLLVKNVNTPYGKVFVPRTKESLEMEEIVGRIKRRDVHLSHYVNAICDHLLSQTKQKEEANGIIEEIIRRLIVLFEQKTNDLSQENKLLKDKLKFIKEEHDFLKVQVAEALSNLKIEVTPPPVEEYQKPQKRGAFNG